MNNVIEIWRHMTWREKASAFAASALYGAGLGGGMMYVATYAFFPGLHPGAALWKTVAVMFGLVLFVRGFMRWQKSFYASTQWARANGIGAGDMNVSDFYGAAFWSLGLRKRR